MVLRAIQASSSSGTVALGQAVLDDSTTNDKRGKYIAYMSIGFVMGPTLGPVGQRKLIRHWHVNRLTLVHV